MKGEQVALKPVTFINRLNNKKPSVSDTSKIVDVAAPSGRTDIALIDEAHLLRTQGNQAYQGHNMLLDVMRRAKVTVAVFDPAQILEGAQQWGGPDLGDQAAVGRPDADGAGGGGRRRGR
ncbi:DNA/RNA helicase domain-containing protein [Paratractidigestivibacter sp.]|uniref:DNA/RNA helicase domain-containing protein n=1 Tax=Paratractidigestivibacter sp. TaxID=2847316 RepID=UPI002ACB0D0A|nr:DNA/RNA helicase domain-containing protein [Paratractidigestivibacter sp.]